MTECFFFLGGRYEQATHNTRSGCYNRIAPTPPSLWCPQSHPIRRLVLSSSPCGLHQWLQQRSSHASLGVVHHPTSGEPTEWSGLLSLNIAYLVELFPATLLLRFGFGWRLWKAVGVSRSLSSCYSSPVLVLTQTLLVVLIIQSGFRVNHNLRQSETFLGEFIPFCLNDWGSEDGDLFSFKLGLKTERSIWFALFLMCSFWLEKNHW